MKISEIITEANINQQLSLYHPETASYRQVPIPQSDSIDSNDYTAKRKRVNHHSDSEVDASSKASYPEPEDSAEKIQLKRIFDKILPDLSQSQRQFIDMRFNQDMPIEEIAGRFQISKERARMIEKKLLYSLRKKYGDSLRSALGK
jgi:RNA polymerase sigma factor (sigma-70 family)